MGNQLGFIRASVGLQPQRKPLAKRNLSMRPTSGVTPRRVPEKPRLQCAVADLLRLICSALRRIDVRDRMAQQEGQP